MIAAVALLSAVPLAAGTSSCDRWLHVLYGKLPYAEYSVVDRAARCLEGNTGGGHETIAMVWPWLPRRAARPSSSSFFGVWNWDCAFMALAMAKWDAELARDQFRVFADLQRADGMYPDCWKWVDGGAFREGVFDGASKQEVDFAYESVAHTCLDAGAIDVFISATQERNESIWAARGAFLEAIKASTTEMDECDVVVPRSHVAEFVLFSHALQKKHGVRIRSFGHAGDGNLHIYVLRDDLAEDAWKRTLAAIFEELYAKARELGGQVSGEHGIGYAKKPYLRESLDPAVRALMRGIKAAFDPKNILNPGKVVAPD